MDFEQKLDIILFEDIVNEDIVNEDILKWLIDKVVWGIFDSVKVLLRVIIANPTAAVIEQLGQWAKDVGGVIAKALRSENKKDALDRGREDELIRSRDLASELSLPTEAFEKMQEAINSAYDEAIENLKAVVN